MTPTWSCMFQSVRIKIKTVLLCWNWSPWSHFVLVAVFILSPAVDIQGLTAWMCDLKVKGVTVDSLIPFLYVCINIIQCVFSPNCNLNMLLDHKVLCRPSLASCPMNGIYICTKYYLLDSSKCLHWSLKCWRQATFIQRLPWCQLYVFMSIIG